MVGLNTEVLMDTTCTYPRVLCIYIFKPLAGALELSREAATGTPKGKNKFFPNTATDCLQNPSDGTVNMLVHVETMSKLSTAEEGNLAPPYVPATLRLSVPWGY